MKDLTIPMYRAKRKDDIDYVIGYLGKLQGGGFTIGDTQYKNKLQKIDESTLAIHFPNMLDSEGTKIFASLSEDGKGGDMFRWEGEDFIIWFCNKSLKILATNKDNFNSNCHDSLHEWYSNHDGTYHLKAIGIQK